MRRTGAWYAAALGDTCLFHVRGGVLYKAFPISDSRYFDTSPPLLGSSCLDANLIAARVQLVKGGCQRGDHFYLCTDALAAWFLSQAAQECQPWEILDSTDRTFLDSWLATARADGLIRNDDVTLVHVNTW